LPVFKTGAFNRSATPPGAKIVSPAPGRSAGRRIPAIARTCC
jgi:hypothetical protein